MSRGNESALRFSLEESVWFQKGQEVEDLISISLDPDITIHDNDQYVTIEGTLRLTGEYNCQNREPSSEELPSSPKFVQEIEEREEGLIEFTHHFPVDITIPNHRVQSIYDIDVEVESFDYVFPERSCLKLTADLMISGLTGDESTPVVDNEESVEARVPENELEPAFLSSIPIENEDDPVEQPGPVSERVEQEEELGEELEPVPSAEELFTPFEVEARKVTDEEETAEPILMEKVQQDETPIVAIQETVEEEPMQISFSAQRKDTKRPQDNVYSMIDRRPHSSYDDYESPEMMESESSSSSSSSEQVKKKKKSKKQSMTLTEFFARKDEDERVAKLKVCIVQNGDTIDLLAERYEVSAQQILKVNQLELNQDVYEGQVLYIPEPVHC